MAGGNQKLVDAIVRILSDTREEKPVEDVYKEVRQYCESNRPKEKFDRAIGEVVNLGLALHRNTLEYKGVIANEDEDEAGPSDCYGRNRRGGRRKRSPARRQSKCPGLKRQIVATKAAFPLPIEYAMVD
uniref:Uncharacterized protein n=1 Tax=Glossina morsitans morsitans TaxID=37546 RepID=A0A1B0FA46_GLOMM